MKEIIEILATLDEFHNSLIFKVMSKLNQLIELDEGEKLEIAQSVSRSWETGASTDLRIGPIQNTQKIEQLRSLMALLAEAKAIQYEEQHAFNDKSVSFIITACDTRLLENFTAPQGMLAVVQPSNTIIRISLAGDTYVQGIAENSSAVNSFDMMGLTPGIEEPKKEWFSIPELLGSLHQLAKPNIIDVQHQLRNLLNIKFEIYFHSSSAQFPIDLRTTSLSLASAETQALSRSLDSLTLLNCLKIECKETEGDEIIYIIKEVKPARLERLSLKSEKEANEEMLLAIINHLKMRFPQNQVIQDLIIFDGEANRSVTRPYRHIRTLNLHSCDKEDYQEALAQFRKIKAKFQSLVTFDYRKSAADIRDEDRSEYTNKMTSNSSHAQLIFDISPKFSAEDLVRLKAIFDKVGSLPQCRYTHFSSVLEREVSKPTEAAMLQASR